MIERRRRKRPPYDEAGALERANRLSMILRELRRACAMAANVRLAVAPPQSLRLRSMRENLIDAEEDLARIVREARTVAVVGMKDGSDADAPAFTIPKALKARGLRIIPVNPMIQAALGMTAYKDLASVPEAFDVVDVFRRSENDRRARRRDPGAAAGAPPARGLDADRHPQRRRRRAAGRSRHPGGAGPLHEGLQRALPRAARTRRCRCDDGRTHGRCRAPPPPRRGRPRAAPAAQGARRPRAGRLREAARAAHRRPGAAVPAVDAAIRSSCGCTRCRR